MKIEPILKREDFACQEQYDNAIYSAELLAETYTLEELNELIAKDPKNDIFKHAIYLKTKSIKWYEDENNFPCLIVNICDNTSMVWVHYTEYGVAYDYRDNEYDLEGSNWRRATPEEILKLSNFK
jgi:hypothetical protein